MSDENYTYVSRFNPETKKIETLINWNKNNRYEVQSYENGLLKIRNQYVKKLSDWEEEKSLVRILEVKIFDYSCMKAVVNDDAVRFRNEPNISSEKIYNFKKNDEVRIISRTPEKYSVENSSNYWYLVQDLKGTIGYIYGDYLMIK
jgi:hypothetical protein